MSDPIEANGGKYVSRSAWEEAARELGFRFELAPGLDTPTLGGEVWARAGHPSLASGRDVLVSVDLEVYVPARDAPATALEDRREVLAQAIALNVPTAELGHHMMVVGWLEGGRSGLERAVRKMVEKLIAESDNEECGTEWRARLEQSQRPDAHMPQQLLFTATRNSESSLVVTRLLAASHVVASGGEFREVARSPIPASELAKPEVMRDVLFGELESLRRDFQFEPEIYFESWDDRSRRW